MVLALASFTVLAILVVLACFALPRSARAACRLLFLTFASATFLLFAPTSFLIFASASCVFRRRGGRHIPGRRSARRGADPCRDRADRFHSPCRFVDPLPELLGGDPSLRAAVALDAYNVGRKPAAIAATGTAAMVGPVGCRLQAACDRLTVVIAERAGDAGYSPACSAA